MKYWLAFLTLLALTVFANAQTTTKPDISNTVSQCGSSVPIVGAGAASSPICHGSGALGVLAFTAPGTGINTALGNNLSANGGVTSTIASGATTMGTGAISSGTCATVVTATATNVTTTDSIIANFNGDPTAVTGYTPSTGGMLTIIDYPTSGNVNFKVCNNTGVSITPGAVTINWRVVR
jgi:hypothetical protein